MTYEFFDREMYEAWSIETLATMPELHGSGVQHIDRWVYNSIDRCIFLYDIIDVDQDERLAWAIAVHRHGELHLEELYVKPHARGRGYSSQMLNAVLGVAEKIDQPLRIWIPFADVVDAANIEQVRSMFARRGLRVDRSPMPWAAYCATPGEPIEALPAVELPPKPAFTFAGVTSNSLQLDVDWDSIRENYKVDDEFLKHAKESLERNRELLRRLA